MTHDLGRFVWHLARGLSAIRACTFKQKMSENEFKRQVSSVFTYHQPITSFFWPSLCLFRTLKSHGRLTPWQMLPISDCKPSPALQTLQQSQSWPPEGHLAGLLEQSISAWLAIAPCEVLHLESIHVEYRLKSRIEFSPRSPTFSNVLSPTSPFWGPSNSLPFLYSEALAAAVRPLFLQIHKYTKEKSPKKRKRLAKTCKGATIHGQDLFEGKKRQKHWRMGSPGSLSRIIKKGHSKSMRSTEVPSTACPTSYSTSLLMLSSG